MASRRSTWAEKVCFVVDFDAAQHHVPHVGRLALVLNRGVGRLPWFSSPNDVVAKPFLSTCGRISCGPPASSCDPFASFGGHGASSRGSALSFGGF